MRFLSDSVLLDVCITMMSKYYHIVRDKRKFEEKKKSDRRYFIMSTKETFNINFIFQEPNSSTLKPINMNTEQHTDAVFFLFVFEIQIFLNIFVKIKLYTLRNAYMCTFCKNVFRLYGISYILSQNKQFLNIPVFSSHNQHMVVCCYWFSIMHII